MKVDRCLHEKNLLITFNWTNFAGRLELHQDNVTNVLIAAHMFNITEIIDACCKYIEKQLHPSNCLGIHKFAQQHDLQELTQTAWNYILVKQRYLSGNENDRIVLVGTFHQCHST